jgi:SAM-dependent methyltransferase
LAADWRQAVIPARMLRTLSEGDLDEVHASTQRYYTERIEQYGPTPWGVDWNCAITQEVRFVQLLQVCEFSAPFSLNDIGCGYGALLSYLRRCHPETKIDYVGLDLSPAMIRYASMWRDPRHGRFIVGHISPRRADYSVASGIFNVQLDHSLDRWEGFIAKTLADMRATSRRAFAVNFMAPNSSSQARTQVYRTAPDPWIRFCETKLGSSVDVLADYGLREFTLLVRVPHSSGAEARASDANGRS